MQVAMTTVPQAVAYVGSYGGYKGFGLAMMVEVFCDMFAGGPVASELVPILKQLDVKRSLSQFFVALDISRFQDVTAFKARLQDLTNTIRNLPCSREDVPVIIPGNPEKRTREKRKVDGIPIDDLMYEKFLAIDPAFAEALV